MRLNGAQCSIPFLLDMKLDYFKKKCLTHGFKGLCKDKICAYMLQHLYDKQHDQLYFDLTFHGRSNIPMPMF